MTCLAEVELYKRKKLNIKKNSGGSVSFMVTALKQGHVEIKITASGAGSVDTIIKYILVKVSAFRFCLYVPRYIYLIVA